MKTLRLVALLFLIAPLLYSTNAQCVDKFRITAIDFLDNGETSADASGGHSVDVVKGVCGEDPSTTPEPFFDTLVRLQVRNDHLTKVRISRIRYNLSNPYGPGGRFTSSRLSPAQGFEVDARGGTATVLSFFLDASGAAKTYAGGRTSIPADLGFRNVTFRVTGKTTAGRTVTASARVSVSLDDFNRCSH